MRVPVHPQSVCSLEPWRFINDDNFVSFQLFDWQSNIGSRDENVLEHGLSFCTPCFSLMPFAHFFQHVCIELRYAYSKIDIVLHLWSFSHIYHVVLNSLSYILKPVICIWCWAQASKPMVLSSSVVRLDDWLSREKNVVQSHKRLWIEVSPFFYFVSAALEVYLMGFAS